MKTAILLLAALAAAATAHAQSPGDAMKGRIKPGMYAYQMEVDMGQVPGMPAGMGRQSMQFQHCVTDKDVEKGQFGKGRDKSPANCEMQNFRMSGNKASYRMVCKGEAAMTADNEITFVANGFAMKMKMSMDQGSQRMTMTQRMEGRRVGDCK